jgi:hypothetical protein
MNNKTKAALSIISIYRREVFAIEAPLRDILIIRVLKLDSGQDLCKVSERNTGNVFKGIWRAVLLG